MKDGVVILHGMLLTKRSMALLARHLRGEGFAVLNLTYPSRKVPLDALAEGIHPQVEEFAKTLQGDVHFVGFSMGGLLIRAYLAKHRPENLGRVVMIGTPNKGSEFADRLQDYGWYRWMYGPAGQQLITDQSSFSHHFSPVDYPVGIIAGETRIDPIAARIFGKPNDGKVSVDSTKLDGMTAHTIVSAGHTLMPYSPEIWRKTAHFIKNGAFSAE